MESFSEFLNRMIDAAFWMNVNVLDLNHTILFWTPRDETTHYALADQFGVCSRAIWEILNYKTWKHIA